MRTRVFYFYKNFFDPTKSPVHKRLPLSKPSQRNKGHSNVSAAQLAYFAQQKRKSKQIDIASTIPPERMACTAKTKKRLISELTEDDKKRIIELKNEKVTNVEIGYQTGFSQTQISRVWSSHLQAQRNDANRARSKNADPGNPTDDSGLGSI